jgi:hypothetical protein
MSLQILGLAVSNVEFTTCVYIAPSSVTKCCHDLTQKAWEFLPRALLFRKLTLGAVAPPLLALAQGFVNFVSLRAVVLRVIVTQKWVLRGRNGRIFTPLSAPGVAALQWLATPVAPKGVNWLMLFLMMTMTNMLFSLFFLLTNEPTTYVPHTRPCLWPELLTKTFLTTTPTLCSDNRTALLLARSTPGLASHHL